MAFVINDRVKETTATTGTGTLTLAGAVSGFDSFSAGVGNANSTYYAIVGGTQWEVGIGTYTASGSTLSRTTVLSSSNADALVNFSAGAKDVFVTAPGSKIVFVGGPGSVIPGTMIDYAGTTLPDGYLACDGSNVSRTTYAALFTAISTTWGVGDGSTTFTLPDHRRRVAVGSGGTGTGTLGNAVGNTGGAETHTLLATEMPVHTHVQNSHTHTQDAHAHTTPGGPGGAAPDLNGAYGKATAGGTALSTTSVAATNQAATATNQNAGSGGAHNNMQPSLVVMKIIKT